MEYPRQFTDHSPSVLTSFDGRSYRPHGIMLAFPVSLGVKTVTVEVEVVDAKIDYNLLLGRSWSYAMMAIVYSVFQVIRFPHEEKIVTIDQLYYCKYSASDSSRPDVPLIDRTKRASEGVDVGLYLSLMGTFQSPAPVHTMESKSVFMISSATTLPIMRSFHFRTSYLDDPWNLPEPSTLVGGN